MNVLGVIPARGGSKGIPLKNLTPLNGKPLLYYTVKASMDSEIINRTVVSTDNSLISKVATQLGADVILRPKRLSNDTVTLEPVIFHILNTLQKKEDYLPDVIVLLQNTSPLRTATHIDEALNKLKNEKLDSILSVCETHSFVWKIQNKTIKPLNYNPLKRPNRQDMEKFFQENGAIYATKYSSFINSSCRISGRIGFYKMPVELSYQIDTPHDLFLIEQLMKKNK